MLLVFLLFFLVRSQDLDVKTLSELPLEKLLQVRDTFKEPAEEKTGGPEALALHAKRGGYHHHYEEEHSKKSGKKSIQSIFQASVTALAFLAFGGYLLCLLLQAVKAKSMMVVETTTMAALSALLRPRPRPRPARQRQPRPKPGSKPRPRPKREAWPETDPEEMYYALVHLSEAYATYHTVDYRKFNYTMKSYV